MAVLSGATASGQILGLTQNPTSQVTVYTAPAWTSNVTSPSATAYLKELIICNTTSSPITVTIGVNGYNILQSVSVNGNDTKVLTGLNTMIGAGNTITASASASGINIQASGVVIQ